MIIMAGSVAASQQAGSHDAGAEAESLHPIYQTEAKRK